LRLAEIFPQVPHIGRLNLTTDRASSILENAEIHLGVMALPYVLSIHEEYIADCCTMLVLTGRMSRGVRRNISAKTMHEKLSSAAAGTLNASSLEVFHLLRTIRNAHIHEGGRANKELVETRLALSPSGLRLWRRLAKSVPPSWTLGDRVSIGIPELIAGLAVTNFLADEVNRVLQSTLSARDWARIAVEDAINEDIGNTGNPNQKFRQLKGFVRVNYGVVSIPDGDLRAAATAAGLAV
jgi:hypothetical protein